MGKTLFEKIADGEIPAHVIWEDDVFMAFLDIRPFVEGHTLVIPKKNLGDYIFDLEDEDYLSLMLAAKQVADLLKHKLNCDRVLMSVEGFEVPHVHVHLIPTTIGKGFAVLGPREVTDKELKRVREKLIR